jgi:hypothetical protein
VQAPAASSGMIVGRITKPDGTQLTGDVKQVRVADDN